MNMYRIVVDFMHFLMTAS